MIALITSIMVLVGLAGVVATLLTLPGLWLIVAVGAAVDLWRPETYGLGTLLAAVAMGLTAEIAELVAAGVGAKKAGGSRRSAVASIVGAIVGAIVGTPVMPIVGTILGAAVGAGAGAMLLERTKPERTWADAGRVGQGAAVGRLIATVIKAGFTIAVAILFIAAAIL